MLLKVSAVSAIKIVICSYPAGREVSQFSSLTYSLDVVFILVSSVLEYLTGWLRL